jgi:NADH-quinone oxidoreductase subunit L
MAACASKIPLTFWAMTIGTLAITGVGIPAHRLRRLLFEGRDHRVTIAYMAYIRHTDWPGEVHGALPCAL